MDTFNVKTAFEQLEQIVKEFESGDLDLEASIPKFKTGLDLAKKLKLRLAEIENQIIEIKSDLKLDPSSGPTS